MKYSYILLFALTLSACRKDKLEGLQVPPDISTGLVVNIPFNASATEVATGINGIINKATLTTDHHGIKNQAMHFASSDSSTVDFGGLAGSSFTGNQFTISCWVKMQDTTNVMAILSKRGVGGPWEYSLDNHFNKTHFNLDNWVSDGGTSVYGSDPLKASGNIQLNSWMHVAFVANGKTLVVYINGVLQPGSDDYNANLSFSQTGGHLVIGDGGGWGQHYYFNGDIDDIRMYNRALDVAAIQYLGGL